MFKDYYEILGVGFRATDAEVRSAYQKQTAKWNADRNCGGDVSDMIKSINEAYEILGNTATRAKYDREYLLFKRGGSPQARTGTYGCDYQVHDNDLNAEMGKTRNRASSAESGLKTQLKSDTRIAAKGAWESCKYLVYLFLFATLVGILILAFGAA